MPLYHVQIQLNNERAVIAVDHVLEEYGVSEQDLFCTWFVDRPEIQGDGETLEQALQYLFKNLEFSKNFNNPSVDKIRHEFYKSMKSSRAKFQTPIIGEYGPIE